jgi:hypothetical protein
MVDWFRSQPKIGTQRLPALPATPGRPASPTPMAMPPLPATPTAMPPLPPTPTTMPRLPATPPRPPGWAKAATPTQLPEDKLGASARVVMHHFARSEVRNLTSQADALHAQVVARLRAVPEFAAAGDEQITDMIRQITFRLQQSDLTVNFKAANWFRTPNTSRTYQQMYERGAQIGVDESGQREVRIVGNAMNKADVRDAADTRVTFGANVDTPQLQGVARFMQSGGLTEAPTPNGQGRSHKVGNRNFNPKARQNFAALNYAKRGAGPAPEYGESLLVLSPRLKVNAIYYMGDTFSGGITAAQRATYGMIFSLILYADDMVLKGILDACYRGITNPPEEAWNGVRQMIEAHIFEEVRFSSDVEMMICKPEVAKPELRLTILNNAKLFCNQNGIRFVSVG